VDWGTGKVTDVRDAAAGDGAYCDGCDNSITTGLVYDVVLTPYGASKGRVAVLCEACFEDLSSDMDVEERAPGGEFLVLVEPWFCSRRRVAAAGVVQPPGAGERKGQ
jgi:hypothetical protein